MKKANLIIWLILFCAFSFAQNRTLDSLKVALKNSNEDSNKVKTLINSLEIKADQDKKDALTKAESQKQKLIILFVVCGLLGVIIFAGFVFRSLRIRNKQNKIIENQKREIESSYKNLELLNNISSEITSSLNLERVMGLVYKNVSALMDVSFFLISVYKEDENSVEVKYCVKNGVVVKEEFKTSILNPNSYIAKTIETKKEIIVLDEEKERHLHLEGNSMLHGKEDLDTKSHIFIPLIIKKKVIGLFSVQTMRKQAYTPAQIDLLRSLSPVIAVALNNAESYDKLDKANEVITEQKNTVHEKNKSLEESFNNIEIISKIGQKITSTLNIQEVVDVLFDYLNTVMDAKGFSIYLYNTNNQCLELKYGNDKYKFANANSISITEENSFGVWCIKNKKEIFINDLKNEFQNYVSNYYWHSTNEEETIKSFINIPLFVKNETVGFVSIHSFTKNAYSKSHLEVFKSLSSYIAVALNNAEAYHKLDTAKVEITAQKAIVEEKQKEILDSIEYALRIQTAILPPQKIVKQYLQNSFILYKPKDIVAGDFYWMETLDSPTETGKGFVLFAACDCTGHGVPGAMVSVVCYNALNRAVREFGLTQPAAILDKTTALVIDNFAKSEEEIKDGMDIALCSYHPQTKTLQYAGANNALWIIRKIEADSSTSPLITQNIQTGFELLETKADKQPIGMSEDNHTFTNHEFNLNEGDSIYLFSDGFADQFSPEDKKLMRKRFKDLLLSIQHLSPEEQRNYLDNFIEKWKGNMEQTDDILVMGFKV